jgi:hypothetical protein
VLFLGGLQRPELEVDHSPPRSAENVDIYTYFPILLHGIIFNYLA